MTNEQNFFRIGRLKCNEQLRKVYHFGLSLKVVKAEKKAASLKAIVLSGWGVDQESGLKLYPPMPPAFPAPKMLARPVLATSVICRPKT